MDRDANWGCVRGMINVTPRGAGSCAKKHHSPLVGARGNHKSGLTRRRQEKSRFWGAKTERVTLFFMELFHCPRKNIRQCLPRWHSDLMPGVLHFIRATCSRSSPISFSVVFCINILILQVKQMLLTEKQDVISS